MSSALIVIFLILFCVDRSSAQQQCSSSSSSSSSSSAYVFSSTSTYNCQDTRSIVYDEAKATLYAACYSGGIISVHNSTVTTIVNSTQCPNPTSIFYDYHSQTIYAACFAGVIGVRNGVSFSIGKQCRLPLSIVYDYASDTLFAACNDVGVVSIHNGTVTSLASISQCSGAGSIVYDSLSATLFAACPSAGVVSMRLDVNLSVTVSTVATSDQCPIPHSVYHDADSATLYATCFFGVVISVRNNVVSAVSSSSQCLNPQSVFYDSSAGAVYVACSGGGVISLHNGALTTIASSTQFPSPFVVYYVASSNTVYAGNSVGVVGVHGSFLSIAVPSSQCLNPQSLSYDASSTTVYAACSSSIISVHASAASILTSKQQCSNPTSIVYDSSSATVYAACPGSGLASASAFLGIISVRLDTSEVTAIATSVQCPSPSSIVYDPASATLYAACNSGGIISVHNSTVTTIVNSTQCPNPTSIFYDYHSQTIYAACSNGVSVISIHNGAFTSFSSASFCPFPQSIFYDPSSSSLFVGCSTVVVTASGGVGVFSLSLPNGAVTTLVNSSQCQTAVSLAWDPSSTTLYVACRSGSVLSVHNGSLSTVLTPSQCSLPIAVYYDVSSSTLLAACDGQSVSSSIVSLSRSCPVGSSFSFDAGCNSCAAGRFGSARGICSPCRAGTYSNYATTGTGTGTGGAGVVSVSGGGGGSSSGGGLTMCLPCARGTWSGAAQSMCSNCVAGRVGYGNSTTSLCDGPCPSGYFCVYGQPFPLSCGSNSVYCPLGSNFSSIVPAGSYSVGGADDGSTRSSTLVCPSGYYCASGFKLPCLPGTYSLSNSSTCSFCSPGSFSPSSAASSCSPCQSGFYSSFSGVSSCTPCPFGEFVNGTSATACMSCPLGTVSLSPNASSTCRACAPGSYSATAAFKCLLCTPGTYSLVWGSTGCLSCDAAGLFCQNGQALVQTGYWGYVTTTTTTTTNAGSGSGSEVLVVNTVPCSNQLCLQGAIGQQCAYGRLNNPNNVLCGTCLPGWSEWNGSCIDCTHGTQGGLVVLLVFLSWVCVVVLHFVSQSRHDSSLFGIFVYFVQTALLMTGSVGGWLQWLSFVNFQPQNSLSSSSSSSLCPFYLTPYQRIAIAIIMPLFFAALLLFNASIHYLLTVIKLSLPLSLPVRLPPFSLDSYIRTSVSLSLYSYSQVAASVFEYLNCVDSGVGTHVVFASPSIECGGSEYQQWLPLVVAALIIDVVAMPLAIVAFLYWKRRYFTSESSVSSLKLIRFSTRWGVLFEPYRVDLQYFQSLVLLRRVICVAFDSFIISNLQWKMFSFTVVHQVFIFFNLYARPYATAEANHLETVLFVVLVTMGMILTANPPLMYPLWLQLMMTLLIVVPCIMFAGWFTWTKIDTLRQRNRENVEKNTNDNNNSERERGFDSAASDESRALRLSPLTSAGLTIDRSLALQSSSSSSSVFNASAQDEQINDQNNARHQTESTRRSGIAIELIETNNT